MDGASVLEMLKGHEGSPDLLPSAIDLASIEPLPDPLNHNFKINMDKQVDKCSHAEHQAIPINGFEISPLSTPNDGKMIVMPNVGFQLPIGQQVQPEDQSSINSITTSLTPELIKKYVQDIDNIIDSMPSNNLLSHTTSTNSISNAKDEHDPAIAVPSRSEGPHLPSVSNVFGMGVVQVNEVFDTDRMFFFPSTPLQMVPETRDSQETRTAAPRSPFPPPPMTSPFDSPDSQPLQLLSHPQNAQHSLNHSGLIQSQNVAELEPAAAPIQQPNNYKPPSRFCHICVRPASRFGFLLCVNNAAGSCRKVICKRCFDELGWDWNASANDPFWTCCHCNANCPKRASCHTYNRSNKKRHPRRGPSDPSNKRNKTE